MSFRRNFQTVVSPRFYARNGESVLRLSWPYFVNVGLHGDRSANYCEPTLFVNCPCFNLGDLAKCPPEDGPSSRLHPRSGLVLLAKSPEFAAKHQLCEGDVKEAGSP